MTLLFVVVTPEFSAKPATKPETKVVRSSIHFITDTNRATSPRSKPTASITLANRFPRSLRSLMVAIPLALLALAAAAQVTLPPPVEISQGWQL